LLASTAAASVIQIPLPELNGDYPATKTTSIHLSPAPIFIRGAWLRVAGLESVGEASCNGHLVPYPLALNGYMDDHWWHASEQLPLVSGAFDCSAPFDSTYLPPYYPKPNWDFLLDGDADLTLVGDFPITVCEGVVLNPSARVDSVIFYLDADFPVPTQAVTWARVRAFYR
jgi:hypothetical protein